MKTIIPLFMAFILGAFTFGAAVWITVEYVHPVTINNEMGGEVIYYPWYNTSKSAVVIEPEKQMCQDMKVK